MHIYGKNQLIYVNRTRNLIEKISHILITVAQQALSWRKGEIRTVWPDMSWMIPFCATLCVEKMTTTIALCDDSNTSLLHLFDTSSPGHRHDS